MKKLEEYKKTDVNGEENRDENGFNEKETKRLGRVQFILVLVLFAIVICVTELVSMLMGKIAGNVALVIITAAVAIYLYRTEIKRWLNRK